VKRLARCLAAALLASAFVAPVYASPPPVIAPVVAAVSTSTPPAYWKAVSTAGYFKVVPTDTPVPTATPTPTPTPLPPPVPTVADAQAYALSVLGSAEYSCLYSIIQGESRWRVTVWNAKGSGAYGLGQAKPASKMAPFGADYMTNPVTQVRWMIAYVTKKFGSACGAARYRAVHGFY